MLSRPNFRAASFALAIPYSRADLSSPSSGTTTVILMDSCGWASLTRSVTTRFSRPDARTRPTSTDIIFMLGLYQHSPRGLCDEKCPRRSAGEAGLRLSLFTATQSARPPRMGRESFPLNPAGINTAAGLVVPLGELPGSFPGLFPLVISQAIWVQSCPYPRGRASRDAVCPDGGRRKPQALIPATALDRPRGFCGRRGRRLARAARIGDAGFQKRTQTN